ncbi:hypothetical protein SB96558_3197 [Shigella boydii 965-58]|nr:hypothetical protein SB96558_3197 [Shigella boydii 965-58]
MCNGLALTGLSTFWFSAFPRNKSDHLFLHTAPRPQPVSRIQQHDAIQSIPFARQYFYLAIVLTWLLSG